MKKIIKIISNGVTIDETNSSIHSTVYELRKDIYYSKVLRKHQNIDTEYIVSSLDDYDVKCMIPSNSVYDVFKSMRLPIARLCIAPTARPRKPEGG